MGRGDRGGYTPPPTPPTVEVHTYRVSFLKRLLRLRCLVEGCLGGASIRTSLRVHFARRHLRDAILILEEGNQYYPSCPQFDMFVSIKALNGRLLATAYCLRGAERKLHSLSE